MSRGKANKREVRKMIWIDDGGAGYKGLTLREIVEEMKREYRADEEPLNGERLGDLTVREIVEKARQYYAQLGGVY